MTHSDRIFYGAAIQGAAQRSERAHINRIIIEAVKSAGFSVLTEHTTGLDFNDTANKLEASIGPLPPVGNERTVFIRNKMIHFIESEIAGAIFEVSIPSLGTGIEIAHAYLRPRMGLLEIPIIALYQKGFWPNDLSTMIRGIKKESVPHFDLFEYESPGEIPALISPLLIELKRAEPTAHKTASGRVTARKCQHCGHHEIGLEKIDGVYIPLKPGMGVKIDDIPEH